MFFSPFSIFFIKMKAVRGLFIAFCLVAALFASADLDQQLEPESEPQYSTELDMVRFLMEKKKVVIYTEPQFDSEKCAPEWTSFGSLCEETSLAKHAKKDAKSLMKSTEKFKSVLENFARDMSIIFEGVRFINRHQYNHHLSNSGVFFFLDLKVHQSLIEFNTLVDEILKNKDNIHHHLPKIKA